MLKQQRRLFLVAAYNINELPDHDGDAATIGAIALIRSTPAPVEQRSDGGHAGNAGCSSELAMPASTRTPISV